MFHSRIHLAGALMLSGLMAVSYSVAGAADTKSSNKLSTADANFLKEAASGGMMEVELGKVAQDKASNEKVKNFGKRMEQDHSKANDELKQLASTKGVDLPSSLDSKHKSLVDRLSKLSGPDFDRQYMNEMVKDHKEDVSKFQSQANKAKDSEVKQFASKTLPTLKEHLQIAESTAKDVKGGTKTSQK